MAALSYSFFPAKTKLPSVTVPWTVTPSLTAVESWVDWEAEEDEEESAEEEEDGVVTVEGTVTLTPAEDWLGAQAVNPNPPINPNSRNAFFMFRFLLYRIKGEMATTSLDADRVS